MFYVHIFLEISCIISFYISVEAINDPTSVRFYMESNLFAQILECWGVYKADQRLFTRVGIIIAPVREFRKFIRAFIKQSSRFAH